MWGWDVEYFWVVDGEKLWKGKRERERQGERTDDLAPS